MGYDLSFLDSADNKSKATDTNATTRRYDLSFLNSEASADEPTSANQAPLEQTSTRQAPLAPYVPPETKQEKGIWDSITDGIESFGKGLRRELGQGIEAAQYMADSINKNLIYPVAALAEDGINAVTGRDSQVMHNLLHETAKRVKEQDEKYSKGTILEDSSVQLSDIIAMGATLPVAVGSGAVNAARAGAALSVTGGIGERAENTIDSTERSDIAKDAAIGAIAGAGAHKLLTSLSATAQKILDKTKVSQEIYDFAERSGLSKEKVNYILEGVDREKHAFILANYVGPNGTGVIKQALKSSDTAIMNFNKQANARADSLRQIADKDAMDEVLKVAKDNYEDLVELFAKNPIAMDATNLLKGVNLKTPLTGFNEGKLFKSLTDLRSSIEKGGNIISVDDLLRLNQDLNEIIPKLTLTSEKVQMQILKTNVNNILRMSDNLPAEYRVMVNSALDGYSNAMQNQALVDAIKASVNPHNRIDYSKVVTRLEKEGLNTPESREVLRIAQEYDRKFSNDYRMFQNTLGTDTGGGVLGFVGLLLSVVKEYAIRFGEYGNNVKIQKQILSMLKKSSNPYEFVAKVSTNFDTPASIRSRFTDILNNAKNVDLTGYNIDGKQIAARLQQSAVKLDNQIRSIELSIDGQVEKIAKLQARFKEAPTNMGLHRQINKAIQRLLILQSKHKLARENLEKMGVSVKRAGFGEHQEFPNAPTVEPK